MPKLYCKAYYLKDLRPFSEWSEAENYDGTKLSDDDIVYLWDDLTVVRSPIVSENSIIYQQVTLAWQEFCFTKLQFSVPEEIKQHEYANNR